MIKRDITETVYEYDKEGKLIKKTVIEKHEEENPNSILNNHDNWWNNPTTIPCDKMFYDNSTGTNIATSVHNDNNSVTLG